MIHELKILPGYFKPVAANEKRAELRVMDRPYAVGDELYLKEWNPATETFTGKYSRRIITHILPQDVLVKGDAKMGMLSIRPMTKAEKDAT